MKSKSSRVGRNFQAPIPPLLTAKEQEEDRAKYLNSRPLPQPSVPPATLRGVSQPKLFDTDNLDRQYEQPILPATSPDPPQLSKTLYDKVVAKARRQYQATLEARRVKMQSRRKSTRPRGMRGQRYRDWDDLDNFSFEEDFSPEPSSPAETPPKEQLHARRKKRARSRKRGKSDRRKTRYVPNRIKPVIIDLVDLSDSSETPSPRMKKLRSDTPVGTYYRTGSQNRLIHTLRRTLYPYNIPQPTSLFEQRPQAPPLQYKVLNNLGINHIPFQSQRSVQKVMGKLMGYRQSPSNSMIPVIEL